MWIKGLVSVDETDRLVEIELEITDPEIIEKIQIGQIKDFSLEPKPAVKAEILCKHTNLKTFNTNPPHNKCLDCGQLMVRGSSNGTR